MISSKNNLSCNGYNSSHDDKPLIELLPNHNKVGCLVDVIFNLMLSLNYWLDDTVRTVRPETPLTRAGSLDIGSHQLNANMNESTKLLEYI